jgi:hypothetical protein
MLTPPGTPSSSNDWSFVNNGLANVVPPSRPRQLALGLLVSTLLLVLAACGAASSNKNNPPPPNAPTVASFLPTSGPSGTTVVLTGTNLTGATAVKLNGKAAATFTVDSATQITATIAAGSSTGKISVATSAGTGTSAGSFTVTDPPTISSFSPTSGVAGTSVTITGTNFTGATSVKFNSVSATSFTVNSATQITAVVGNGTTTGKITVATANGTGTSATNFTINPPAPTISNFNPGTGPVGTSVVITGTNFTGATSVAFNGKAANGFTINSATQITATVASATTSGKVTVTTSGGTGTSATNFTVTSSGATLDLSVEGLYVTQATQEYPNPIVPLVQNRSAWVRVFVKANQANTATPQVQVDFIKSGSPTHTLTINAGVSSVPLSIDPENAAASWNAAVDKTWIVPGTQVLATVDPTNAIPEADESNNLSSQNLDVRNLKTWKITLIPVHTGDGNVGNVQNAPRTKNDWVDFAKRIHPVPDAIDVVVGSVFNSSVPSLKSDDSDHHWTTLLSELATKRTADGVTDRYYYGAVHTTYNSGVAGYGYIGTPPVAIGWDANGSFASVFAHEEGHNFNRAHSPCGGAGSPDLNYPYPGAIIGVPGWDAFAASNNIKGSASYTDVMGYCSTQWISDYVYVSELTYRQNSPMGDIVPDVQGDQASGEGLLIWGRILNGQVTLEPAFRIPANQNVATPGPYTWEARDGAGRLLSSISFNAPEVADVPDDASVQMFSFVVPLHADILAAIQTMHVKLGNQELAHRSVAVTAPAEFEDAVHMTDLPGNALQITWDAERYPVLMLRDAGTGEVRGFVRGGNAQIQAAPREIVVHPPDAARGEVVRHRRTPE